MELRAAEIAEVTGGRLVGPDVVVRGAGIDSREQVPGALFVPIVDARDGHDFIGAAVERGAPAYLTARAVDRPPAGASAIVVADTGRALEVLGRHARERLATGAGFRAAVGITGSVGKTTTKDLLAAVLGEQLVVGASLRSFNNELGVPLTLLDAPDGTEAVVIEMGARGPGHIALLCSIARPTIGVVTAVELVHTETFGSLDDVARAKAELVEALPVDGTAVLNADNPLVAAMAERTDAAVLTFSTGATTADVRAENIVVGDDLRARFRLRAPTGSIDVELGVRGGHNVANALAAAAAALAVGIPLDAVAAGLAGAEASPWRMELHTTSTGARILNDAYNAGPASMAAALRALATLDAPRPAAVLGPMAELGAQSDSAHGAIAALAAELGIRIVAVAAPAYGGGPGVEHVADRDAALEALIGGGPLGRDDAVLVKGSRVAGLEALAAALTAEASSNPAPTG